MLFELGKYYQHTSGHRIHLLSEIDSYIYGKTVIAEDDHGQFTPVDTKTHSASVNYFEITKSIFESDPLTSSIIKGEG